MTTRQALFLVGANAIFAIAAMRWFDISWRQLGFMMTYVREGGGWGGLRSAGIWSITMFGHTPLGQLSEVNAHFTNYPAIFFFILAGGNIFLVLAFVLWNNLRKSL